MDSPKVILSKFWNYDSFRPLQEEIIDSVLKGRDTLAILPTGGGKSICFQVPALIMDGMCLVVSPLISLMKDQTETLKKKGIKALAIYSGMTRDEIDITLNNAIFGEYKFLYMSPERLKSDIVRARIDKMGINMIVVDEAHCISQWGYDFRPSYLEIPQILEIIGKVPIMALTATATPKVADDIMAKLNFSEKNVIKGSFFRDNISFVCRQTEDKYGQLLKICTAINGTGIVYVRERKRAEEAASFLKAQGVDAEAYHAGLSADVRSSKQYDWKTNVCRIIVATNAFGMGIDKPDVRFVCHLDIPDSPEAYYQEAGRGGRDGKLAYAVIIWNKTDIKRLEQILRVTYPEIEYMKDVYQKLHSYLGIAYGDGKGSIFKFDLMDFCTKAKLHSLSAYYALKYIQLEGYLDVTEEIDNPSRLRFIVNRDELYKVQLKNTSLDSFIKTILRMYTGLFSHYVVIDEEYIARMSRNSKAAVKTSLMELSRMKIVSYIPAMRSPLIILNEERLDDKNLYISAAALSERRGVFSNRVGLMQRYASNDDICRASFLCSYFGEENNIRCGVCDVCKRAGNSSSQELRIKEIREKIVELLKTNSMDIKSLILNLENYSKDEVTYTIRSMIDYDIIRLNNDEISLI